jgi:hypothetical protein
MCLIEEGEQYWSFQLVCVNIRSYTMHNYLMRVSYFTKQSHLCFMMSEQPIELSLVKIELLSNTLGPLHTKAVQVERPWELNGQTLLRVQRNGLKIASQ